MYGFHQAQLLSNMAIGIFTLRQQLRGLLVGNWPGAKTPYVEYLVVGGGGGGGGSFNAGDGAGGGGGGVLTGLLPVTTGTSYTVTVGGGGAGGSSSANTVAGSGVNSSLSNVTAVGGGGGWASGTATAGGSGSGGNTGSTAGAQGISGQGNAGGTAVATANFGTGGGGGAGTVGLNGSTTAGGNGGAGISSAISGTVTPYGGGGGGAVYSSGTSGTGGVGGGGAAGLGATGTAGQANTGGGGGGAGYSAAHYAGGAGGSGIVIISYPDIYPALTTGGATSPTVSTSGSGSISFNGSSQYLTFPDSAVLKPGTGDFTLEAWVYHNTAAGSTNAYQSNPTNGISFNRNTGGKLEFSQSSVATLATSTNNIPINQWVHIAAVRIGTALKLYINGVQEASVSNSTNFTFTGTTTVGSSTGSFLMSGYISNYRLVKGVGVYTGAFTPPTSPLQATQPAGTNIAAITGTATSLLLNAISSSLYADSSTNCLSATATAAPPWNTATPFATGQGLQNRVYTWAPTVASGGTATGTFTV